MCVLFDRIGRIIMVYILINIQLRQLFDFFASVKQTKTNKIVVQAALNNDVEDDDDIKSSAEKVVSVSNLHAMFNSLGLLVPEDKVQEIIRTHSSGERRGITFAEFLVFFCNLTKSRSNAYEMKEVFRLLDDDDDGFVEVFKLKHVIGGMFPELSNKQVLDLLSSAYPEDTELQHVSFRDFYKHGKLNYDGFVRFLFADVHRAEERTQSKKRDERKKIK